MKKLGHLVTAFVLFAALTGCGKSSKGSSPTAPPPPGGGTGEPQTRSEAMPIAQQSAQLALSYVEQVQSLIGVVTVPGSKPARVRPSRGQAGAADTSSWTYTFQGYDATGAPIDYVTQQGQLASMSMDWVWFYRTTGDSLLLEIDMRSHSHVDGFLPAATRYVASATDTLHEAYDATSSGSHSTWLYDSRWQISNLAWEKSGTPAYPVAGTIVLHLHYVYDTTYNGSHYRGDYTVDGSITFNGTRYATIVIGTYTFTVDLETGTVS